MGSPWGFAPLSEKDWIGYWSTPKNLHLYVRVTVPNLVYRSNGVNKNIRRNPIKF